jgi:hypothetical protein
MITYLPPIPDGLTRGRRAAPRRDPESPFPQIIL